MSKSQYDFIVFGATSFVGKILCEYMIAYYGDSQNVSWAAAGRSGSKLEALRASLGPKAQNIPLIVADSSDESSLKNMVSKTGVVISTVGPYALYGEPLVKVCAETGTDYADLTGEIQWARRMASKYEETAKKSGSRIIHCCGFDSIPSDMGVYYLQHHAKSLYGEICTRVKMGVMDVKGGASGGSLASWINIAKEVAENPAIREELNDPYSLCPAGHAFNVKQKNTNCVTFDADFNAWRAPFFMEFINSRIVHRSNALSGNKYGTDFLYSETLLFKKGLLGQLIAIGDAVGMASLMAMLTFKPTRKILEKFVTQPGEGPSLEAQTKGLWDFRFVGETPNGKKIHVKVAGDRDPGYGSTAKMLAQTAICLAKDVSQEDQHGGFLTPATAFGDALIERLVAHAGLTFETL